MAQKRDFYEVLGVAKPATDEEIRKKHYAASGLSSAQQQALSSTINTNVVSQGIQAVPSNMQTLKNISKAHSMPIASQNLPKIKVNNYSKF